MDDEAEPLADLGQDRLAVLGLGRRRLLVADRAEKQGRREVGHRVDRDGDRRGQDLDEEAADPEGHELGGGPARGEGAVRVDEALALDDRRQVGVVGGIEEGRQDRRQSGHDEQLRERQDAEREGDRHRPEQDGPSEVGPDEDRPPPQPIDPGAGDEPEDERRAEVEPAQDRDLDRARPEHEDRDQRQRDPGDERPEDRDASPPTRRGRTPSCARAGTRTDCARSRSIGRPTRVRQDHRPAASRGRLRYTPPCSVRQNSRTTRDGARRSGPPP